MTTVISVLAGIALLLFVSLRQLRWRPVDPRRLVLMPLVLLVAGGVAGAQSVQSLGSLHPGVLDAMSITIELVLGVVGGLLMGRLTRFRVIDSRWSARLTGAGLAVWFGFIAFRIGMAVLAHSTGAELAASTPLIFVMIAIVKGVQAIVITRRVARLRAETDAAPSRVETEQARLG